MLRHIIGLGLREKGDIEEGPEMSAQRLYEDWALVYHLPEYPVCVAGQLCCDITWI
jgi:hypothetical protein